MKFIYIFLNKIILYLISIEISNLRLSTIKQKNQYENEKKELSDKLLLQTK